MPASPSVEQLHRDYAGPLFVYAWRRLGDRRLAEEVVQDTLLKAWRHAGRYDADRASVGTWLFTIARNLTTDQLRRRGARPAEVALDGHDEALDDREVERTLEAWQLAEALRGLSDEHRRAIVEVHWLGYSIGEVAHRYGVPPGTVKSRLYYGLRALRLRLDELGVTR